MQTKNSAASEIRKLSPDIQKRIIEKIASLEDNPRPNGCVKLKSNLDLYRARVGKFRIIYHIDDPCATVTITRVSHRRDAYT